MKTLTKVALAFLTGIPILAHALNSALGPLEGNYSILINGKYGTRINYDHSTP